jgi:hypothetical protein
MGKPFKNQKASPKEEAKSSARIEKWMKRISLGVSLLSLAFMISGFVLFFFIENTDSLPGTPAMPLKSILFWSQRSLDLLLMSLGIVLLGLIPAVRLLLAVGAYLLSGDLRNVLIGLVVLLELLLSMRLSL